MFLTSREQKLIQTFLKRGKLTIAEMMEITDTSRRYKSQNALSRFEQFTKVFTRKYQFGKY